jgi:hypothetical protein
MCNGPRFTATSLLLAGLLLLSAGCGEKQVQIRGNVTLDGKPIDTGAITFIPNDLSKGQTAGASITLGEFQVVGNNLPPPGLYRVEIRGQKKTGKQIPAGSPSPPGTMVEQTIEAVPAKYNYKSELKQELKTGDNKLNFELTSQK